MNSGTPLTIPGQPSVILHLGLGSFHRAHQAVYLHRMMALGGASWLLKSGNLRPDMPETVQALQRQSGRYTLETVSPDGQRDYMELSSLQEVVAWTENLDRLISIGRDPQTRIISFTVTEGGYFLDAQDKLDLDAPEVSDDLRAARQGRVGSAKGSTLYGALTAILRARMEDGAGPVTLLNCDNLRDGGHRCREALLQFAGSLGDSRLLDWLQTHTTSPNAMVDRITPRPTLAVRQRVLNATGRDDPAAIMAETFIQWVIEDDFIAGRPVWEKVGVEMVSDVRPYEEAKLRILNATHSCVAWAGTLCGYQYIHEGMREPRIAKLAHDYVTNDVIPGLQPSPVRLEAYRDIVFERFSNPDIRDTNQRVAADAFSKIPGFIVPTIRQRLDAGHRIDDVAVLPALFLACLQRWHQGRLQYEYQDQVMDPAVAHGICRSPSPLKAFCEDLTLWGTIAGDRRLLDAVTRGYGKVCELEALFAVKV